MNKRTRTGAFAGLVMAVAFVGACSSAGSATTAPTAAAATALRRWPPDGSLDGSVHGSVDGSLDGRSVRQCRRDG